MALSKRVCFFPPYGQVLNWEASLNDTKGREKQSQPRKPPFSRVCLAWCARERESGLSLCIRPDLIEALLSERARHKFASRLFSQPSSWSQTEHMWRCYDPNVVGFWNCSLGLKIEFHSRSSNRGWSTQYTHIWCLRAKKKNKKTHNLTQILLTTNLCFLTFKSKHF